MDLNLTSEEEAFRDELRGWLEAHAPKDWEHRRDESIEDTSTSSSAGSARSMKAAGPASPGRTNTEDAAPA